MPLPVVGKAHEAKGAEAPFTWFIYGSSLDRAAFAAWAEQHGYRVPDFARAVPARLPGYRLAFDVMSNFWGGAVASLAESAGDFVEGIALPMPAEARGLVEHKEGAISGLYAMFRAEAEPLAGGPAIPVVVYRGAASKRLPAERAPSPRFVETIARGAADFGLSAGWIARLEALRVPA